MGSGEFDWRGYWFTFAGYALVIAVLFAIFFRHKHVKEPPFMKQVLSGKIKLPAEGIFCRKKRGFYLSINSHLTFT
jgi:hypothetical protein